MNIDSIFLFVFIFSSLFITRIIANIILSIMATPPKKIIYTNRNLLYLGLTLSYIITYLITNKL